MEKRIPGKFPNYGRKEYQVKYLPVVNTEQVFEYTSGKTIGKQNMCSILYHWFSKPLPFI